MTKLIRRSFLGRFFGGAAVAAIPVTAVAAQPTAEETQARFAALQAKRKEGVAQIVDQLLRYNLKNPLIMPKAVQIPFASGPVNLYLRAKDSDELEFLRPIMADLLHGSPWTAQEVATELFERIFYGKLPAAAKVPQLMKAPGVGRTVSPRLVIDEAEFTTAACAQLLLGSVLTVAQEICDECINAIADSPGKRITALQVTPITFALKRDRPMLEAFAYANWIGRTTPFADFRKLPQYDLRLQLSTM